MTNKEASRMVRAVVDATFGSVSKCDNHDAYHEAFQMAIDALEDGWNAAAHYNEGYYDAVNSNCWVKTADRLPTKEDAGPEKCVIYCRRWDKGVYTELREWDSFKHYPYDDGEVVYWMPLPKLPEVEGCHSER